MDSSRIKRLATGARDQLRNEIAGKLDAVLAADSTQRLSNPEAVKRIEGALAAQGRERVIDSAAYTWFNRLCALRFMDANGYTSTALVTPREGSTQPAVLADAMQGSFDSTYQFSAQTKERVVALLSGGASSKNATEDAYAELLRGACEHFAAPMPYLFSEDAASNLLMPSGLLAQGSILRRIVEEMDEATCESVEVLGWLYQFYIAERKDEYFASKKKATAEDIPAATQLFTPEWIVRYLTENSLGRLWMLNNPGSKLAQGMDYYIAPESEEEYLAIDSASEIQVLDPACGSGHILVYAFDLLYQMYEEEGYLPESIPERILKNNLFGLEIDRRAAEIAKFALEMKALERDPHFLEKNIDARVHVLEPVVIDEGSLSLLSQSFKEQVELLDAMAHMDEIGSLYVPTAGDAEAIQSEIERLEPQDDMLARALVEQLHIMLANVEALSGVYHVVVANPPYMGTSAMEAWASNWVKDNYPNEKGDLCTCFINRSLQALKYAGYAALVTMQSWMFLGSYENMREALIEHESIATMAHLGARAFDAIGGEVVSTTATVFQHSHSTAKQGSYFRLVDLVGEEAKSAALREAIKNHDCGWFYRANAEDFKSIPGSPIAYWTGQGTRDAFVRAESLESYAHPRKGLATTDNARFLRLWHEVSWDNFVTSAQNAMGAAQTRKKWFPLNKGGDFRRWYGNRTYCINWQDDGSEMKAAIVDKYHGGSYTKEIRSEAKYFLPSITWSALTSGAPSFRFSPAGTLFDSAGSSMHPPKEDLLYILGLCNTSVASEILSLLNPTLNYGAGSVANIPVLYDELRANVQIGLLAETNIALARADWDAFETSWDFVRHPLLFERDYSRTLPNGSKEIVRNYGEPRPCYLSEFFDIWQAECQERFDQLKANEEELNRIFARIYNMEDEVPIEVPDDKVSVRLADRARDAKSLISYGVGCMLGRYSTQADGLVLADAGQTVEDFKRIVAGKDVGQLPSDLFLPDEDNILPVLDGEWFEDDIVASFYRWLENTYGTESLDANVAWLEESIGTDLRSYFCKDFYADHVRTYQKRPIYWMLSSPKGAFRCLIYMHRYNAGTIGDALTKYLRPYQDKLRSRMQLLENSDRARDVKEADKLRAQLAELDAWEKEVIYPLTHERIEIDLDDGVKVNYNKFPHALAKVQGLSEWK